MEFLVSKGFGRDDLKPTAKLTEEMYRSLQQEFQSDKVAKTKADQIEIPKGAPAERRKRDEEEITFRKEKEEPKVEKQPEPVVEETHAIEEKVAATHKVETRSETAECRTGNNKN